MELTNEMRDRIFSLYIGCDIKHSDGSKSQLVGLSPYEGLAQVLNNSGDDWWNYHDDKIILKPLSSISDENIIEIAELAGIESGSTQQLIKEVKQWLFGYNDGIDTDSDNKSNYLKVADFLRSKSYALPYMGQDLFTLGIAEEI